MTICESCGAAGTEHEPGCLLVAQRREMTSWREEANQADRDRRRDALPKWEYRVVASWADRTDIEQVNAKLNEIGAEGWELVAILDYWYHFKRQLVL